MAADAPRPEPAPAPAAQDAASAAAEGSGVAAAPSYDAAFFDALEPGVMRSAAVAAALLVTLLRPRSVVDVGCGTGQWLAAFRAAGVADIVGVDGDWVPRDRLAIPSDRFIAHDLALPLTLGRRFDLALSLETAEHLPPEAAAIFVRSLVGLAPVVVFSAAIPGQIGTGHINERWPSYWRPLFAAHGYRCLTSLRERLWAQEAVEVWYRQNMLVFAAEGHAGAVAAALAPPGRLPPLDIVHPALYGRERRNVENWTVHAQGLQARLGECARELDEARHRLAALEAENERLREIENERLREAEDARLDEAEDGPPGDADA